MYKELPCPCLSFFLPPLTCPSVIFPHLPASSLIFRRLPSSLSVLAPPPLPSSFSSVSSLSPSPPPPSRLCTPSLLPSPSLLTVPSPFFHPSLSLSLLTPPFPCSLLPIPCSLPYSTESSNLPLATLLAKLFQSKKLQKNKLKRHVSVLLRCQNMHECWLILLHPTKAMAVQCNQCDLCNCLQQLKHY